MKRVVVLLLIMYAGHFNNVYSQAFDDKFRQLEEIWPTANDYRTASGAPGHAYWQQQVDYKIKVEIDDATQKLMGEEIITYTNNSPDTLTYLWMQLDQNYLDKNSDTYSVRTNKVPEKANIGDLNRIWPTYDGGFKIEQVQEISGKPLTYFINRTMMRVDLPSKLAPKQSYSYKVKWWYNINDRMKVGGRSGYEYFAGEDNYIYTMAQFYPRLCAYYDVYGWQHKQFLGSGEFTLDFGNYEVSITVPEDHVLGASGVLQNTKEVLSATQAERFLKAKTSDSPVMIVSPEEALAAEKGKAKGKKTWTFKAVNVRDFAFASSRKFIWDAMGVKFGDRTVMAMSYYPKEGNPLWEKYSTKVVAHTIKWYSHYTFDYPYPVAISVHTDRIGMEYPMICFNGGRPEKDGTYSERTKYGMLGVIIHEVGHNYFPMIVNSDERQWTWMDEGLNTFLQYLTEQQWERDYPSGRGPANKIVDYMKGDPAKLEPIMTNSESLRQFGSNAYAKPATALNILRETILGRELFDYAFKTYSRRWMFKRPTPADFFRSIEDASGTDLDWFWKGWYYTTDNVDLGLAEVKWFKLDTKNPEVEFARKKEEENEAPKNISTIRNQKEITATYEDQDPTLKDFYSDYDKFNVTVLDKNEYQKYLDGLGPEEKAMLESGMNYYEITIERIGGLVMPIIVSLEYTDGTNDVYRIPAEIWRYGDMKVTKVFRSQKDLQQVVLDPFLETADIDTNNNVFPEKQNISRFELFKGRAEGRGEGGGENPMQKAAKAKGK
jgi:hypothetical protein